MKKTLFILSAFSIFSMLSCKKEDNSSIALTASATQVLTGQTVNLKVSTDKNTVSWTVSPDVSVTKQYTITHSKTNTVSFAQPGTYTVSVKAKELSFDSQTESIDSSWNAEGDHEHGDCHKDNDSTSVNITVTGK